MSIVHTPVGDALTIGLGNVGLPPSFLWLYTAGLKFRGTKNAPVHGKWRLNVSRIISGLSLRLRHKIHTKGELLVVNGPLAQSKLISRFILRLASSCVGDRYNLPPKFEQSGLLNFLASDTINQQIRTKVGVSVW